MPRVEVPDEFCCCFTVEPFIDPVVAADGNSYERVEILKWFNERKQTTSPRTNLPLEDFSLRPNVQLKTAVARFKTSLLCEEAFTAAIKTGDLKTLEARPFLDVTEFRPLLIAVESNQLLVLKYMVGQMPTELVKNPDLLFYARSRAMVLYLVEDCKMPLEMVGARTALEHFANGYSDCPEEDVLDIVAELLRLGADAKRKTEKGGSVFDLVHRPLPVVKLLVTGGAASPDVVSYTLLNTRWGATDWYVDRFLYILSLIGDEGQQIALIHRSEDSVISRCVLNPKLLKMLFLPPYALKANGTHESGITAIHNWVGFIQTESLPSLSLLLNDGKCNIDAKEKRSGATALHKAVEFGRVECVNLLVAAGANTKILDNRGKCAFDYCEKDCLLSFYRSAIRLSSINYLSPHGLFAPEYVPASSSSASAASASASASNSPSSSSSALASSASKKRNADVGLLENCALDGDENDDSKRPTKRMNLSAGNGSTEVSLDEKGEPSLNICVCMSLLLRL